MEWNVDGSRVESESIDRRIRTVESIRADLSGLLIREPRT